MQSLILKLRKLSQALGADSVICLERMADDAGPEYRDRWLENGGAKNAVDVIVELLKGNSLPFDKFLAEIREFADEQTEQEAA